MPYLDLGAIPLVNRYVAPDDVDAAEPRFPLVILRCASCSLSQLSLVVDRDVLYGHYLYRSSIARTFVEHCRDGARSLVASLGLGPRDLVVDLASNDGCALREFAVQGVRVLGVEPARNLADLARASGVPTVAEFWSASTAERLVAEHGPARLVTAMNVLAHVDDPGAFLDAVAMVLAPDGTLVVEVPYLVNFVNRYEFDTTYHEHLSYFLVRPLLRLFADHGFVITDIRPFEIHGGTLRIFARRHGASGATPNARAIDRCLALERDLGLYDHAAYSRFSKDVLRIKAELVECLVALRRAGGTIAAYGASAKGTVLTNYCGIGRELLDYVVDDTPEKQGLLTPGMRIGIVSAAQLREARPDYLLLLAWNFAEELIAKTRDYRDEGGRYVIPIPSIRII